MLGQPNRFQTSLLRWYDAHHRKLPWRIVGPDSHKSLDPYHVLVSEAMLQQTQVATVIPYFHRFLAAFPTVDALASADEQAVLRLWQGLGYYSRARNLQRAAQEVVARFGGKIPATVEELRTLPGVGRYTAGAVASIAHGKRTPILDGNVARVLCRLDAVTADPREKETTELLWTRADQILPTERLGDFNSAMMELGATVCTPRSPQCLVCPVCAHCEAAAKNIQEQIPPPKVRKENPLERRLVFCIQSGDRWLIEQRPPTGRWAGMWQFVTTEGHADATSDSVKETAGIAVRSLQELGVVRHALTHRRYEFRAYRCAARTRPLDTASPRRWVTLSELNRYPLSKPQLAIARLLHGEN